MTARLILLPSMLLLIAAAPTTSKPANPKFVETGIAGVTFGDGPSGDRFVLANGEGTKVDVDWVWASSETGEVIALGIHHGGGAYQRASIWRTDASPLFFNGARAGGFVSSRGVRLGLSSAEVRKALGKPRSTRTTDDGRVEWHYSCDASECAVLQPYADEGQPTTYSATVVFGKGRVVLYSFGIDDAC